MIASAKVVRYVVAYTRLNHWKERVVDQMTWMLWLPRGVSTAVAEQYIEEKINAVKGWRCESMIELEQSPGPNFDKRAIKIEVEEIKAFMEIKQEQAV